MSPLPPELAAVNEIFLKEISDHLVAFRAILSDASISERSTAEQEKLRHGLENRFHVIRGGAGFLQHAQLAACSTRGEKLFRDAKGGERIAEIVTNELPALIQTLEEELARISHA
ncbi:MAG: Hpt domain-containing protein [Deltaproteobacteria bacterium]|nr:Hpt domain-containing protein [Deltaproteobacteria bacterium]